MAKVIIPTPLRKFTENQASIEVSGNTVKEAILDIASHFPDVKKHLFETDGRLRGYIRIYVGDEDIRALDNEETSIEDSSVLSIVPAIAGGIELPPIKGMMQQPVQTRSVMVTMPVSVT